MTKISSTHGLDTRDGRLPGDIVSRKRDIRRRLASSARASDVKVDIVGLKASDGVVPEDGE